MDKYVAQHSVLYFDVLERTRSKNRLRILWYLWKRESIDSYTFNNTEDIVYGIQTMLNDKVYPRKIIDQLELHTLHYLFPEKNRLNYGKLHQKRYLLLQRLFDFIGDHAGFSFAVRYGYLEQAETIGYLEQRELFNLENSILSLCDFLTKLSVKDIKKVNFYSLMR